MKQLTGLLPICANCKKIRDDKGYWNQIESYIHTHSEAEFSFAFLAAFVLSQAYFTYVQLSLAARIMNFSLGLLIPASQCAWLLFRRVDSVMRPITRGTGMVFGAYCGLSLLRMILILAGPSAERVFLQSGAMETLLIMTYQMLFIVQTYSLVMMVNRRLMVDIQSQEERFRGMVEFSSDWNYWIGPDGKLFYTTPSCERVTGYGPREFIDDPELRKKIVHPEDQAVVRDHSHEAASTLAPLSLDYRIVTRDGETRWINHVCAPVYDSGGRRLGRVAGNRDITERRDVQRKLQESEETYRNLFQNAQVGLYRTRISDSTIIESNDQLARMFGYEHREEFITEYVTSENYVDPGTREKMTGYVRSRVR